MASDPKFASTPRFEFARVAAANTNRDGTGTIVSLITGVAAGTRVTSITAVAEVTTTAGMFRIWSTVDAGTTWRLFDELPVPALTPSASVPAWRIRRTYDDLILRSASHIIGITMHNAEAVVAHAAGGDLT